MQCPKCGWQNPDNATKCNNCFTEMTAAAGQPQPTQQMPQQPYAQQPQQPYGQQPYGQQPYGPGAVPDYMVWSIVVAIISLPCCACLPVSVAFAIVAIVKSSQANNKKAMGDYLGALRESNAAKTWLYWAVGLDAAGLIGWVIYLLFVVMAVGSSHGMH